MITLQKNGKQYLMQDGFTFYRHKSVKGGFRWSCTHSSRCRAHLIVADGWRLVRSVDLHNHERPKYMALADGTYIKV
ncbi:unnamed protein product, partial [Iphiclides podalirius]